MEKHWTVILNDGKKVIVEDVWAETKEGAIIAGRALAKQRSAEDGREYRLTGIGEGDDD